VSDIGHGNLILCSHRIAASRGSFRLDNWRALTTGVFVGVDNLLTEGPSDYLYLTIFGGYLRVTALVRRVDGSGDCSAQPDGSRARYRVGDGVMTRRASRHDWIATPPIASPPVYWYWCGG
jgi:hypothetical protein